jgi:glucose/arabinose dehydrogenase
MKRLLWLTVSFLGFAPTVPAADAPRVLCEGLRHPTSVAVGQGGRVYVTVLGEPGKDGDGAVMLVDKGKAVTFATRLDDPSAVAAYQDWLFVADRQRVWRIGKTGKAEVAVAVSGFPVPPKSLRDIAADPESGTLYVSDHSGAIYRVPPKGKVGLVTDAKRLPALRSPAGLTLDGQAHLLVTDATTGAMHRIKLAGGSAEQLADGFPGGLTWDYYGQLFGSDTAKGRLLGIPRPGDQPVPLTATFQAPADICLDASGKAILVPDSKAGTLTAVPTTIPDFAVDQTPLPLEPAVAFPDLQWTGWQAEDERGRIVPLRPIVLTHAGDGSTRVFVATQHGVIHVFPNDQKATRTKVFLDLRDRVTYRDDQNEEGFLGMAFHPRYKENGEFFVFYTMKKAKLTNVVARFKVSKDDPDRADPASEEEVIRFTKPFWNHDGGTIAFGPDGYLYVTHGDGGAANDPFDNGQNLKTLLGKVLRLDVDRRAANKGYAIPADNPFRDRTWARPEIWAYGLRNVWRMAFDRATGKLWAADVGQNLWEEINLIEGGGNYGWSRRESLHPFSAKGVGVQKNLIDPIWEYHHDVGKSITGGLVYHGKRLPELAGMYLYADYVSGKIWALRYDGTKERVVANRPIADRGMPILSFGEDEQGEAYFLIATPSGKGLHWFVRSKVPTP